MCHVLYVSCHVSCVMCHMSPTKQNKNSGGGGGQSGGACQWGVCHQWGYPVLFTCNKAISRLTVTLFDISGPFWPYASPCGVSHFFSVVILWLQNLTVGLSKLFWSKVHELNWRKLRKTQIRHNANLQFNLGIQAMLNTFIFKGGHRNWFWITTIYFSPNRPTGPIRSSSRDVRLSVCLSVCLMSPSHAIFFKCWSQNGS